MCGLVGIAGDIFHKEKKAFKLLHIFDIIRGRDSSGIFTVNDKDVVESVKAVGYPDRLEEAEPALFDWKDGTVSGLGLCVLAGHNRAATQGKVTNENAHPFDFDKIIGMHNGTLNKNLLNKFELFSKSEVDSEILFGEINKSGIKQVYNRIDGAWALVWYNKERRTISFIRNEQRPLYFAYFNNFRSMMWASEKWMMLAAAGKANITDLEEPQMFKQHTLYEFYPNGDGHKKGLLYLEPIKLEPRKVPIYPHNTVNNFYEYNNYKYNPDKAKPTDNKVTELKDSKKGYAYYRNTTISKEAMHYNLSQSFPCVYCNELVDDTEKAKNMLWFDRKTYVCEKCLQNEAEVAQYLPKMLYTA